MKRFIVFLVTWVGSNLAIPFWMVGHVHLTSNVYEDIYEILASFGMNIIVAIGFWLEWKKHKKELYEQQTTDECQY
jgi:hypothetical protein